MLVYRGLHRIAPSYIADMCVKRSFESEHYNLRSTVRGEFVVPLAGKTLSVVVALNTAVHHFGTHYRIKFEIIA